MVNSTALICLLLIFIFDFLIVVVIQRLHKLYSIYPILALISMIMADVANIAIACTKNEGVIYFAESCYYILSMLEFFFFYKLFSKYIYNTNETRIVDVLIRGLIVVDVVLLLANTWTK